MGLHNYAAASNGLAQELVKTLTREDVLALAADLKTLGSKAWIKWTSEHRVEVQDFLRSPPAAREKKVKWRDPVLRRRLNLAAIVLCNEAHELLAVLAEYEGLLAAGGSYRDTTVSAGKAYCEIINTEVLDWPEELEQVCPFPFEH